MPQDCHHIRENLSAWLDEELPEEERQEVAAHLDRCSACGRELALLQHLETALAALEAPVPAGLPDRVLARLRRRRPWWRSVALAASVILGVTLGGLLARDLSMTTASPEGGAEVITLEEFHDFPQGSFGAVMVSYQVYEGNGS
jgi:anti-sigma factor (TIGR02949 family)